MSNSSAIRCTTIISTTTSAASEVMVEMCIRDRLVAHADAPVRARDLHIVPAAEIVDVADPPAGLQDLYDGDERIHIAARDEDVYKRQLSIRMIETIGRVRRNSSRTLNISVMSAK